MRSKILKIINSFIKRDGNYVASATLISRFFSFLVSLIVIKLLDNNELGAVIFAYQFILLISPISSGGLNQSLIRFGSISNSKQKKRAYFIYAFKNGLLLNVAFILIIILSVFLIDFKLPKTKNYLILISFALIPLYVFELIKIKFRLFKKNKSFAKAEIIFNAINIVTAFVSSYYFNTLGYAISIVVVPAIVSLLYFKEIYSSFKEPIIKIKINLNYWSYGFFASLSSVTSQLLISIDILLIGMLLTNLELVTAFKYVAIIPYSFLILSHIVMLTDFVFITEKIKNKNYISAYTRNYVTLYSILSVACIVFVLLFGKYILMVFDKTYPKYIFEMVILTFGISGILILRGLFGNLLSAIGKSHINFFITSFALLLNLILNFILIPKYGITGAAITSTILMWLTGLASYILFSIHYKKYIPFNKN